MATPQVGGNHDPSLSTQCLAFIQTLVNQKIGFNFHLTSGQFSCSFDSNGTVTAASARIPTEAKKKSPSTRRRNAKRRQQFLENKKLGSSSVDCGKPPQSACEKPPQPSAHKEPTQPSSESLCFPSASESADLDPNSHGVGHITKKMRMDIVPPLKVLVDAQSSPKYRIQQFDGNSSLSDLSLCENDQHCERVDDSNIDRWPLCPYCDQTLTPNKSGNYCCDDLCVRTSYLITRDRIEDLTFDPFMGPHNKKCEEAREKWKNNCLEQIECTSLSDEYRERQRKLLNKKLCFCYKKRIENFC